MLIFFWLDLSLLVLYWLDPIVEIFLWCFQYTLLVPAPRSFDLALLNGDSCATVVLTSMGACSNKTALSSGFS